MSRTVRIGIVGTSWWTDQTHLPALASHPQAEVVALCGRNREKAAALAARHGVAEVYTDHREMFARAVGARFRSCSGMYTCGRLRAPASSWRPLSRGCR